MVLGPERAEECGKCIFSRINPTTARLTTKVYGVSIVSLPLYPDPSSDIYGVVKHGD